MENSFYSERRKRLTRQYYGIKTWPRPSMRKRSWMCTVRGLRQEVRNYCESTTLHGFRYITSDEVSGVGKLTWLMVCMMSTSLSVYLMLTVWNKYKMTPAVISVESTAYPIWGFSFPAVTICNLNKVYEPLADNMTERLKSCGMNDTEIKNLYDALPSLIHEKYSKTDFHHGMETLARIGFGPEELMYHLMQPCDKLIIECTWLSKPYDCRKIFKMVKTLRGFCCSFNYHVLYGEFSNKDYNSMDQPVSSDITDLPGVHEPLMVPGSGRDSGLYVLINVESKTYRAAVAPYFGASVMIHDPIIFPEINIQHFIIQPGQDISLYVKGDVIESEESLRRLSIEQRKCWFNDEIKLNSSSHYTYETCITECRMEYIHAHCNCVPFYYPNTNYVQGGGVMTKCDASACGGHNLKGARTCGLEDVGCLRLYKAVLSLLEAPYDYGIITNSTSTIKLDVRCRNQCFPECTEKTYTFITDAATVTHDDENAGKFFDDNSHLGSSSESAILIYYPDITCLKYRRETVMTWENLLAAFGGIFGLCIGGSFVSVIEVIYFMFIRIFRPRKVGFMKKTLPVYGLDKNRPIEDQSVARKKDLLNEWKNSNFENRFHCNKSREIVSRNTLNIPKRELNRTAFTIDLTKPHYRI